MYKGEKLRLRIKSSEHYDLTEIDFSIYIYPCGFPTTKYKKTKDDCEFDPVDSFYICTYEGSETARYPIGAYTIEIHDADNEVIYIRRNAFSIHPSAASIDIRNQE